MTAATRRRNRAAAITAHAPVADQHSCWWTESGWHCCANDATPWPSCVAGGVYKSGVQTSAPQPPPGSYQAAVAAGAVPNITPGTYNWKVWPHGARERNVNPALAIAGQAGLPVTPWYVVVNSASAVPPTIYEYIVMVTTDRGWLHRVGRQAQLVTLYDKKSGGPSGLMARAAPVVAAVVPSEPFAGNFPEALAPFSRGSSVMPSGGARVGNPDESECMVDLDALVLLCPGTSMDGAEILDIPESAEAGSTVEVTFAGPDGTPMTGRFRVAPYQGTPWWEHDGHCCESCATGGGCEGG